MFRPHDSRLFTIKRVAEREFLVWIATQGIKSMKQIGTDQFGIGISMKSFKQIVRYIRIVDSFDTIVRLDDFEP